MADDTDYNDKRRAERVAANFSVAFREISETEAALWAERENDDAAPAPPAVAHAPHAASAPGHPGVTSPLSGKSVNLSQGGLSLTGDLQLLGEHHMARGSKVLVEFTLPGEADKIACAAVVAWSLEGRGERGKFTAGLMFLGMRPSDLEKISKFVNYKQN